ncbi:protein of unknown function [Limimaricola pyoseonensis]|uniref:DUF4174 domain-containing protein n=2 Tax=Limimaricola pyoseonensis TaxID=521013 RepID=A0A1G7CZW0_9RHOB|nr:protein of unknown function [Limimaricola pyoseonensis]
MFRIMGQVFTLPAACLAAIIAVGQAAAAQEPAEALISRWQDQPAAAYPVGEAELEQFEYRLRPVIVFADSPDDPQFRRQIALLGELVDELVARDVIILIDTDPDARSPIRRSLRPRGFALLLIGKDGRIAQRKPAPFSGRELIRAIDKLPLRQQEIRDANRAPGAARDTTEMTPPQIR